MTRALRRTPITREQFRELTRPLVGMPVTRARRGYGSAIFLELGALTTYTRTYSDRRQVIYTEGQMSLMVQWSWRVESPGAIRFGSWSTESRITRGVASLQGLSVLDVDVEGRLPELVVALDGKRWLHAFMTAEGQPAWGIRLHDDAWISVRRGRLEREGPRPG